MSELLTYLNIFWQNYGDFVINLFISSGIALAVIKFYLKTRLKKIDHKYDGKIEILKSSLSKEITHQAAIYSSFSEGQKAAMERKLLAIDKLWQTLIEFRKNLPSALGFMDILPETQYEKAFLNNEVLKIRFEYMGEIFKDIDEVRPYVGELMWFLFSSYETVLGRIATSISLAQQNNDPEQLYWKKDDDFLNIIKSVLTKEELENFKKLDHFNIRFLKDKLESKIITEMHKVISGKDLVNDSVEQVTLINDAIDKYNQESQNINTPLAKKFNEQK